MSQTVLSVVATEQLTPHMIRIVLGGDGFDDFVTNEFTDKYVKVSFVKPELGLQPPFDITALREQLAQDDWPVVRTYTIRWVDVATRTLAIDFVVHGTEGVAGPWAAAAQVGDVLAFAGPGGGYAPLRDATAHVFAGDESATPAIAAALEALPADAVGFALIEAQDHTDVQLLAAPEGVEIVWVLRSQGEDLATAVAALPWPAGDVQVFAHGERESMKALRAVFAERGVPRERRSLSGYWAKGRTEDRFQAEKREPVGQIGD